MYCTRLRALARVTQIDGGLAYADYTSDRGITKTATRGVKPVFGHRPYTSHVTRLGPRVGTVWFFGPPGADRQSGVGHRRRSRSRDTALRRSGSAASASSAVSSAGPAPRAPTRPAINPRQTRPDRLWPSPVRGQLTPLPANVKAWPLEGLGATTLVLRSEGCSGAGSKARVAWR
eukprot:7391009-Prymnesium_polylepis.1